MARGLADALPGHRLKVTAGARGIASRLIRRAGVAVSHLAAGVVLVGACSAVPNMDAGSAGCQNARGIGPHGGAVAFAPLLIGHAPGDAASIAKAQGHTVVFNVQIEGYGECWCVPPPEGEVVEAWWGEHGALWLRVDDVDKGHTARDQPPLGWGC